MTPRLRSTTWIRPRNLTPTCSRSTSPDIRYRRAELILRGQLAAPEDEACLSASALIHPPHAFLPDDLEYQFGAPAHRYRRQIPEVGEAGCAVPAGDQMRRRCISTETLQ